MTTKEKIIIVNDRDEVIGYKNRNDLDLDKDIYRISALWLTNSRGEVLIAQRTLTKNNNPGRWGPAVAGTVERGETYEQNIYKEAEEEVGLTGEKFTIGPKVLKRGDRSYFCQWYTVVINWPLEQFKIQEEEVAQIRWISRDELEKWVKNSPEDFVTSFPELLKLF